MSRCFALVLLLVAAPLSAQELPEGQSKAEYDAWLATGPAVRGSVLSFESWQQAAGVLGVLPTWQITRTASMWRTCAGPPFEIPPPQHWPGMAKTLRFVRDHVRPAIGPVEAVSGYRNPALNECARGAPGSAHRDYFALDLIPLEPIDRRRLMEKMCAVHAGHGEASGAGLGFYSYLRFHVDTRSFRRWGSAGPAGDESPCAVIERGEDPLAPPIPPRNGEGDRPQDGGGVPPVDPLAPVMPPSQSTPIPAQPPNSAQPQPEPTAPYPPRIGRKPSDRACAECVQSA